MSESEHTPEAHGGCTCGEVRYSVQPPPMIVHCCHCRWCQRETGAAFAVNALFEDDRIQQRQGLLEEVRTPSESGQGQRIVRCARCRVALWSYYAFGKVGDRVRFLRVGTLDVPERMPPDVHIYTASKQPWLVLPKDARAFAEYYRAREVWSADSLARRAALHGS